MDGCILSAISYFFFLSIFDLEVTVFHSRLIYGGSKRMQVIPVVDIKYPHASAYALCLLCAIRRQQKSKEKKKGGYSLQLK